MNIEAYREYCISKPGVTEEFPFDETTLVFKVMGKMFAATNVDNFVSFNAKCDPEKAIDLREEWSGIVPGYHMSKKHWNTIKVDGSVPNELMLQLLDDSYALVVSGLTKKLKAELAALQA